MFRAFVLITAAASVALVAAQASPEQIHIALTDVPGNISITWVTLNETAVNLVHFGAMTTSNTIKADSTMFQPGGDRKIYIHRAWIQGLKPTKEYTYKVESDKQVSVEYKFTVPSDKNDWSPRFAVYGDMGYANAHSLTWIAKEVDNGDFDAILHVGDFGYDLNTDNGTIGDKFMRSIEPIAARLPYMTIPGNHEQSENFTHYTNRFTMPSNDGFFWSTDVGPAHIIGITTEFYYFVYYGIMQIPRQYQWLKDDLAKVNRTKTPWVIVMGHRPMYCSNNDDRDLCNANENIIRTGVPFLHWYPLEPLFCEYGVDLGIWAHEHSYERLFPTYNRKATNTYPKGKPYKNPEATVHVITGSAGCQEDHDGFVKKFAPWSAFHSIDYGYSRLTVHNATHLFMDYRSDDKNGTVIDQMWIVQQKHGAGRFKCR